MVEVHILVEGFLSDEDDHVRSTVGFVRDGGALIVIDPGMVPNAASILDPLRALGVGPPDVTEVVLSHHHRGRSLNTRQRVEIVLQRIEALRAPIGLCLR